VDGCCCRNSDRQQSVLFINKWSVYENDPALKATVISRMLMTFIILSEAEHCAVPFLLLLNLA